MYWLAVAVGVALLAMFATGGRVVRLLNVPVQALWMLLVGLGIQIALALVDFPSERIDDAGFGLLMFSYALLLAFTLANFRLRGMAIVTVGLAMNAVVIGLNEGMPTRDRQVENRAGQEVERPVERTAVERPESDDDLVPFLGQIIRLPEQSGRRVPLSRRHRRSPWASWSSSWPADAPGANGDEPRMTNPSRNRSRRSTTKRSSPWSTRPRARSDPATAAGAGAASDAGAAAGSRNRHRSRSRRPSLRRPNAARRAAAQAPHRSWRSGEPSCASSPATATSTTTATTTQSA